MDYIDQDYADVQACCAEIFAETEQEINTTPKVRVTYLPPQKVPRWARTYTAVARGTSLGNGNYVRMGVGGAE